MNIYFLHSHTFDLSAIEILVDKNKSIMKYSKKKNNSKNLFKLIFKVLKKKKFDNFIYILEELNSIRRYVEKKF